MVYVLYHDVMTDQTDAPPAASNASPAPGAANELMSDEARGRKRLIRTLRFLLLLGVVGLSYTEATKGDLPWQFWFAAGVYFVSNVVYHFERTDIFKSFRASSALFLFDGAVLTYMMVLLGGGSNVFYVLLAITLLIAAVTRTVASAFYTTIVVGSLYTFLSLRGVSGVALFGSESFLIHTALFFVLSIFVAYFAREADRVRNAARVRLEVARDQREALEGLVRERTASLEARSTELQAKTDALEAAVDRLERAERTIRHSREELIARLVSAAEFRDDESPQHLQRVGAYVELIARGMGLDEERVDILRVAAIMHDLGKIGIPDAILLKRQVLTPQETEILKRHAEIGHQILANSETELLKAAALVAWTHHERLDGRGYPRHLRGEEIPLEGRIVAVADEFDTMTTKRANRDLVPVSEAFGILRDGAGVLYDRDAVRTFLAEKERVQEIRTRYVDRHDDSKEKLKALLHNPSAPLRMDDGS